MILIDTALQKRETENNPIKVAIIGAGIMGQGIINQICRYSPGIEIVVVYNRTLSKAENAIKTLGIENYAIAESNTEYKRARDLGKMVLTQNIDVLCEGFDVDVVVEVTGTIEFATRTILKAFENGKHVLSFNAEIEATIGPILKYIKLRNMALGIRWLKETNQV